MRRFALAVLATVLLIPAGATAQVSAVKDPNDFKGMLDIVRIQEGASNKGLTLRMAMSTSWRCRDLNAYSRVVAWWVDLPGGGSPNLIGRFACRGSRLRFMLRETGPGGDNFDLRATRPSKRSVQALVPARALGGQTPSVWATSRESGSDVCPRRCYDRAPNRGRM